MLRSHPGKVWKSLEDGRSSVQEFLLWHSRNESARVRVRVRVDVGSIPSLAQLLRDLGLP